MNGDDHTRARRRPRFLWGRVAFFGVSLVLVFALGAWSAADDTADAELVDARAEIERLAQENVNLRAEKEALEAGGALDAEEASAPDVDDPDDPAGDDPDATDREEPEPDGSEAPDEDGDQDGDAAQAGESAGTPAAAESGSGTYVVREGDTGLSIAEAVYGDKDLWPRIAEANDLGGDNVLQVDQELVIPPSE